MLKRSLLALFLIPASALAFSFTSSKPAPSYQPVLKTIIIDAGHGIIPGGGHNGAKGSYSYEDDICLAVSKKLVTLIGTEFPDVKIVETRPTKFITNLHE